MPLVSSPRRPMAIMKPRRAKLYPTPDDASTAFYDAFERADLAAMMAVWAESDDVVCVHPRGPRLVGFEAVRESWAQIFSSGSPMRVTTTDARKVDGPTITVHAVIEMISSPGSQSPPAPVAATNVFELTDGGWRMVLHHATPMPEKQPAPAPPPPPHVLH